MSRGVRGGAKDVRNKLTVTYRYYGPYSAYEVPYDPQAPDRGPYRSPPYPY